MPNLLSRLLLNPVARLVASPHGLGPYAAMALLLPGGSLIALLVWLTRNGALSTIHRRRIAVAVAALSAMLIFPGGA
jgi:hypothetical protein